MVRITNPSRQHYNPQQPIQSINTKSNSIVSMNNQAAATPVDDAFAATFGNALDQITAPTPSNDDDEVVENENQEPVVAGGVNENAEVEGPAAGGAAAGTYTVQAVLTNVVSKSSRTSYNASNKNFLLYVYSRKAEPTYWRILKDTAHEELGNATNDRELKRIVTRLLKSFVDSNTCPFVLSNLSFDIFSEYIVSRTRGNDQIGERTTFSTSYYQTMRSAFVHLYRTAGTTLPDPFKRQLKNFMGGLARTVAKDIQDRGLSCEQGK